MDLLLDVGNTQTEIGIYKENLKFKSWRISSKVFNTEDEIAALIRNFLKFEDIRFNDIARIAIASVVPDFSYILDRLGQKYFQKQAFFVDAYSKLPLRIVYEPANSVGADRLCAAVEAWSLTPDNLIIIDFGTATTFDVILENGDYIGGIITLGIESTMSALHQKAAKLPKVKLEPAKRIIGSNTEEAIQAGVLNGHALMINALTDAIKKDLSISDKITIYITGGLSKTLSAHLSFPHIYEADLVLNGLSRILNMQSL